MYCINKLGESCCFKKNEGGDDLACWPSELKLLIDTSIAVALALFATGITLACCELQGVVSFLEGYKFPFSLSLFITAAAIVVADTVAYLSSKSSCCSRKPTEPKKKENFEKIDENLITQLNEGKPTTEVLNTMLGTKVDELGEGIKKAQKKPNSQT